MEKSKYEHRDPGIGFGVEDPLKTVDVFEPFVHDRETDNGVNHVRVDRDVSQYTDK